MQGKADIGEFGRMAVAFDAENLFPGQGRALGEDLADIAADHHLDQFGLANVRDPPVPNELPVAEHGEPVGDAKNLVEFVADEQDRLALCLQLFDQLV